MVQHRAGRDACDVARRPSPATPATRRPLATLPPPKLTVRPGRLVLWRAAMRMLAAHPLLGVGPDNFRLAYGAYAGLAGADPRTHSNNMYLEVLAGGGLLGAARVRVAALARRRRARRVVSARPRPAARRRLGVAAAAISRSRVHALGRFVSQLRADLRLFALTLGCASACARGVETRRMRIAFDGTTLRPGRTGVGYYTEHLLHHLARTRVGRRNDRRLEPADRHDVAAAGAGARRDAAVARAADGLDADAAPRVLRAGRVPTSSHFTNGMVPLGVAGADGRDDPRHEPDDVSALPSAAPRAAQSAAGRSGGAPRRRDHHGVREREARHRAPLRPRCRARARRARSGRAVVPAGSRSASSSSACAQRYGLADRFILYVGTIEPRKNLPKLIEAFARAAQAGELPHQLVCAGPYGWLSRDIEELIERLAGRATRSASPATCRSTDLPALYSLAEMFVFPSIYEGFGLPVIEAMACGTPVVTGRVAALAEVGGGAVEHVDPLDADSARATRWSRWRGAASAASELSLLGLQRARRLLVGARRARNARRVSRTRVSRRQSPSAPAPVPAPPTRPCDAMRRRRSVRPGVLPAVRSQAVGGAAAVRAARHAVRRRVRRASAATRRAVRRDAGGVRSGMGRGAGSPPPALRGALRGQLQLPVQDVPAAHAAGGARR